MEKFKKCKNKHMNITDTKWKMYHGVCSFVKNWAAEVVKQWKRKKNDQKRRKVRKEIIRDPWKMEREEEDMREKLKNKWWEEKFI